MRVAWVVPGGLHPSGREQIVPSWLWLLERLARRHEVHAFALQHLPEPVTYTLAGATIHDLGRPGGILAQARAVKRALRALGPFDIVHGFWAAPAGLVAVEAGRALGIPSVVTFDSGEFAEWPSIHYGLQSTLRGRTLVSVTAHFATSVIVCSEYQERLAREHNVPTTRIPLGVDLSRFSDSRLSAFAAAGRFGETPPKLVSTRPSEGEPTPDSRLPTPGFRLLQVASLSPVKAQTVLIDALARVRRDFPSVDLDLVGQDTVGGAVQAHARALGVAEGVTFRGFVNHDDLPALYRQADIYVQSSLHEAAGVSVLEAASSGLPIVGTEVGYVADWAGEAALAVPVNDAPALAEALLLVIGDDRQRSRLAAAALARSAAYDADRTTTLLLGHYERHCKREL